MSGTGRERRGGEGMPEGAEEAEITSKRLGELIRWHGTDESALPPAHTLQNLSRDTVAALRELARARETIARLRAAMGRAFWAASRPELNAILLEALGPPQESASAGMRRGRVPGGAGASAQGAPSREGNPPTRLDSRAGRRARHPASGRSISSRAS